MEETICNTFSNEITRLEKKRTRIYNETERKGERRERLPSPIRRKREMKKLLALALLLMLALPVSALAAPIPMGTEAMETDEGMPWEIISGVFSEIVENGAFFVMEDLGLKIWIPDDLVMIVDDGPGVVWSFYNNELTRGFFVVLNALLEEMDPRMYDIGFLDISRADEGSTFTYAVNGIPCIIYTLDEETRVCAALHLDGGQTVTFLFETPEGSDDDWIIKTVLMITSIQPMDD